MLDTERNTPEMAQEIMDAAVCALRVPDDELQVDFEHGQHWVTHRPSGAQWSAMDAEGSGPGIALGFAFEQVTPGDEDY